MHCRVRIVRGVGIRLLHKGVLGQQTGTTGSRAAERGGGRSGCVTLRMPWTRWTRDALTHQTLDAERCAGGPFLDAGRPPIRSNVATARVLGLLFIES